MRHSPRPRRNIQELGRYYMPDVSTHRSGTNNTTADGLKPDLGFIGGEFNHFLGQFLRQPACEPLVGQNDTQFDGYNAAASNPNTNGIGIPECDVVRFPEVRLFTIANECKGLSIAWNVPELSWSARPLHACLCSTQTVQILHGERSSRSSSWPCDA